MLRFRSLASSSAGNATVVEDHDGTRHTRLLVDCGLSLRKLEARLQDAGLHGGDIDAVFITHEHSDHIGCALAFVQRHRIPLWMSAGTAAAVPGAPDYPLLRRASDGQAITLGSLQVTPFTVPHDAREPLQLSCSNGDRVLALATDLGYASPHVLARLAGCHAIILESNHAPDLLEQSRYPGFLKRRIAGRHGHLSNTQAAAVLDRLMQDPARRLNTVVAAHLSEQNNLPELVRQHFAAALGCGLKDFHVSSPRGLGWLSA